MPFTYFINVNTPENGQEIQLTIPKTGKKFSNVNFSFSLFYDIEKNPPISNNAKPKNINYTIYLKEPLGKEKKVLKKGTVSAVEGPVSFTGEIQNIYIPDIKIEGDVIAPFTIPANINSVDGEYESQIVLDFYGNDGAKYAIASKPVYFILKTDKNYKTPKINSKNIVFSSPLSGQEFLTTENFINVKFTSQRNSIGLANLAKRHGYSISLVDLQTQKQITLGAKQKIIDGLGNNFMSVNETFYINKPIGKYKILAYTFFDNDDAYYNEIDFSIVEKKSLTEILPPIVFFQKKTTTPILPPTIFSLLDEKDQKDVPDGYFDKQKDEPTAKLQIFCEIIKPHNLQVFDDAFFQIDANGVPKNYIPITAEIKTTDKPKKASYKIILRNVINSTETIINDGDLIPLLINSKKQWWNKKIPQEATINISIPLFVNGKYQVYVAAEADDIKGISHTKTFSVNITKKTTTTEAKTEQPFKPVNFPPELLPKIEGTEGIGTISFPEITPIIENYISAPSLKTHLYQKGKNKVLFEIDRFFLVSNSYDSQIKKLQESKQYKLISEIVKEKFINNIYANIYMSEEKPQILSDIVNDSNLVKKLDVSKSELYFQKYLDVNKDYYFIVEAKQETKIDYSQIQKIKVIKDDELYFIENQAAAEIIKGAANTYTLNYYDFVDKEKIKTFLGKMFTQSKFTFSGFNIGGPAAGLISNNNMIVLSGEKFNSSQNTTKYIKLRITSKKTNRKIDLNLNYSFLPNAQPIKDIAEINGKNNKKLNMTLSFSLLNKAPAEFFQQFNLFTNELRKFIPEYNLKFNSEIIENEIVPNENGYTIISFNNVPSVYGLAVAFIDKIKNAKNIALKYQVAEAIFANAAIKVV